MSAQINALLLFELHEVYGLYLHLCGRESCLSHGIFKFRSATHLPLIQLDNILMGSPGIHHSVCKGCFVIKRIAAVIDVIQIVLYLFDRLIPVRSEPVLIIDEIAVILTDPLIRELYYLLPLIWIRSPFMPLSAVMTSSKDAAGVDCPTIFRILLSAKVGSFFCFSIRSFITVSMVV